jgi:hypothetical protein
MSIALPGPRFLNASRDKGLAGRANPFDFREDPDQICGLIAGQRAAFQTDRGVAEFREELSEALEHTFDYDAYATPRPLREEREKREEKGG